MSGSTSRDLIVRAAILRVLGQVPGLPMREENLRRYAEIEVHGLLLSEFRAALRFLENERMAIGIKSRLGGDADNKWRISDYGRSILAEEEGA